MHTKVEGIRAAVLAGKDVPQAIKRALGMTLTSFAKKYNIPRGTVAAHVNGTVRAGDETIAALIAECGGTRLEWIEILYIAARPPELNDRPVTLAAVG